MPTYDLVCTACEAQFIDVVHSIKAEHPPCSACGAPTHTMWTKGAGVIADDIPGGMIIRHGLCNEDGSPRKYYSHSDMRKEAKRRGIDPMVRHLGEKGSDKSKHTVKWT